eukprot:CAMPEP_0170557988 /NCGR_PEP_ID=MMETSP0211-20121228/31794_1 /TAXON_ID=311385 /ORGANISM="Pseudokeronopsis sp., Strain OXSARD2" /LENGTH=309 /DNA_ID=CAMNT_0010869493 /DNA_START=77 /DNA_END=1007 /DNA_ORIENTATION=-
MTNGGLLDVVGTDLVLHNVSEAVVTHPHLLILVPRHIPIVLATAPTHQTPAVSTVVPPLDDRELRRADHAGISKLIGFPFAPGSDSSVVVALGPELLLGVGKLGLPGSKGLFLQSVIVVVFEGCGVVVEEARVGFATVSLFFRAVLALGPLLVELELRFLLRGDGLFFLRHSPDLLRHGVEAFLLQSPLVCEEDLQEGLVGIIFFRLLVEGPQLMEGVLLGQQPQLQIDVPQLPLMLLIEVNRFLQFLLQHEVFALQTPNFGLLLVLVPHTLLWLGVLTTLFHPAPEVRVLLLLLLKEPLQPPSNVFLL